MKKDWHGENGDYWLWGCRIGRAQFSVTIYHNVYFHAPDRWVLRPEFVYDRRRP